jgi:hypothetical protein
LRATVSGLLDLGVRQRVLKLRAGTTPVEDSVAVNTNFFRGVGGFDASHE